MTFMICFYMDVLTKQQRCYGFHYNYPLNDVKYIVNEIKDKGMTSSEPINNMYNHYTTIFSVTCSADIELIILVKSSVGHFDQREAIRSTWGKCHGENVRVVFLLGYSTEFVEHARYEYAEYKDIVQGSFNDEYRNNIYKTLMAYDWVVSNCSNSQFIFFVDDDYFVTLPNLLKFSREKIRSGRDVMFGHKQCNRDPVRSRESKYSKWYISEREYQPLILPPFLSGGSVLTHINVVRKLRIAFPYMKPIYLDDVYVSLVAQKLGIKILHDDRFVNSDLRRMDFNFIISCHNFNSTDYLYEAWLKFKTPNIFERLVDSVISKPPVDLCSTS
ncbi:beta-1,3-galactosyltransferase brn-like [Mytilus californianus]|uniref:beta-1,3-galactosyltransferase brn-like n=1 Tax=Mytilus californianus TaxID=6549 RepID=UPI0022476B37|nr:beta-1,3-galactosyltransferase brn-like [Mytilus californianus]